jgi:hypothetical protein
MTKITQHIFDSKLIIIGPNCKIGMEGHDERPPPSDRSNQKKHPTCIIVSELWIRWRTARIGRSKSFLEMAAVVQSVKGEFC